MPKYAVVYSYLVEVEAKDDNEARDKADELIRDINPKIEEMACAVELVPDQFPL